MRISSILSFILPVASVAAETVATTANYTTLHTSQSGSILTVTINNTASNVNLMNEIVFLDLNKLVTSLQNNTSVKVLVFESGNPLFFSAHYDIMSGPGNDAPLSQLADLASNVLFNITQLPQATIAKIEGPARGIGNEFLFSCDMRFASSKAVFGNFEVTIGLAPGTGGALYMPQLIGRGRAFEYLLSGKDISAKTAEKYGWINKAFNSSGDLDVYVNQLASRIALFRLEALAGIKKSVNAISRPTREELEISKDEFLTLSGQLQTQQILGKFLELSKNETDIAFELNLGQEVLKVYQ